MRTRCFFCTGIVMAGALTAAGISLPARATEPEELKPIGEAKGINPGRVVWAHDPEATDWKGPGDGYWWEAQHTSFERVDAMVSDSLRALTGGATDVAAWHALFRYVNRHRGKAEAGYRPGEKVTLKVNFVGMIWREGCVDTKTYTILERHRNYMNTSPQVIAALLRQLTRVAGVKESDITVTDTLAYITKEYYDILHPRFPGVRFVDFGGKFGRIKASQSSVPLYWSSRPKGTIPDFLPTAIAEADYLINVANLKAHTGAGVTLCAKNHMGSLVRWPAQRGYFDLHPGAFAKKEGIYRPLVDLMGHAHLGGKTVLYLIDGLYSGKHPIERAPRRWTLHPFDGDWTSSVFLSQDPVAIDSVGFDFIRSEWDDSPRTVGVDDYLTEAALAFDPPSGTFYDPDHPSPVTRLPSLGVHEHFNNAREKKYSRNLGTGEGIELISPRPGR